VNPPRRIEMLKPFFPARGEGKPISNGWVDDVVHGYPRSASDG
jgi:hypothetical protein